MSIYNNTGFHNSPDFDMLGVASDGSTSISVGILRNNLAFAGSLTSDTGLGGLIDDQYNSWDTSLGVTVANADFQSVAFAPPASCPAAFSAGGTVCVPPTDTTSFAGMASARQADGSLPVLPFLRLAAGSKLIDKGMDVGLPFLGAAPDLGAFEYGATGGTSGGTGGVTTGTGGARTGGTSGGTGGAGTGGLAGTGGVGTGGAGPGGTLAGAGGTGAGGVADAAGSVAATGGSGQGGNSTAGGGGSGGSTPNHTASNSGCACQVGRSPGRMSGAILFGLFLAWLRIRAWRRRTCAAYTSDQPRGVRS